MGGVEDDRLARAYERALVLEKAGRAEAAARAWRKVLALDPADHGGAAIRLAALGQGATPERAAEAYVRTLFDQHAERFDEVLVERLGYRVPWAMRRMLERHAPGPYARLLDLGCGTGLVGEALGDLAGHVTGVDLSEGMLDRAFDRDVYDDLYVGDVLEFLLAGAEDEAPPWDLVAAADMLPYLGPVAPLLAAVAAETPPGGVWIFSTETLEGAADGPPYAVGRRHRFAHAPRHLRAELERAGFAPVATEDIVVRYEEGQPVPGELVLARRL